MAELICFIASHTGPAQHFYRFAQEIAADRKVEIHAIGAASDALRPLNSARVKHLKDSAHSFEAGLEALVQKCKEASMIIIDIGSEESLVIVKRLRLEFPGKNIVVYYDNPENYVPNYSELAVEIMQLGSSVWTANASYESDPLFTEGELEIALPSFPPTGIGYYDKAKVEELKARRADSADERAKFFQAHDLEDRGQRIVTFFGGNNSRYFDHSLLKMLSLLEKAIAVTDLSDTILVLQQHPVARREEKKDAPIMQKWYEQNAVNRHCPQVVVSKIPSSDVAQVVSDGALYDQTSMSIQFAWIGMRVAQVGECDEDILYRKKIAPHLENAEVMGKWLTFLGKASAEAAEEDGSFEDAIGYKLDWADRLRAAVGIVAHSECMEGENIEGKKGKTK